MDRTDFVCCSKCWHGAERTCHQFIECITQGPLCHTDDACKKKRADRLDAALHRTTAKPVIYIGAGTCGLGAGAGKTLAAAKEYLAKQEIDATIVEVGCIGICTAEPLLDVALPGRQRLSFSNVTAGKVAALLGKVFAGNVPTDMLLGQYAEPHRKPWDNIALLSEHPFFAPQTRIVLENCGVIDPSSIEAYLATGGYEALARTIRSTTPSELCDQVEKSGLRGRGGAGFPAGRKWKTALTTPADRKYFVCNADEGDPGAFMDRAVIEGDPHRLIEGAAIGAYAIGASKAIVYIRAEYPLAIKRLKQAIGEARSLGLIGYNILDSGFNLEIVIKQGAGAFVCGEETALIHSIEGKRGMPRLRPPFPAVSGIEGRPTIINNVETLANLAPLLRRGAAWFASLGTAASKGTKVFALSGKVNRTGLVEIEMGRTIRNIVFDIGGGIPGGKKFKAVQIGGPSGGCIPTQHLDIQIDYESLKTVGAIMGSGGLVVMDEKTCMVDVAKFFMNFIQRESCGKCIPCREGTRRMLEILTKITEGRRTESGTAALERFAGVVALEDLAKVIQDTSLCGLGQTAPNPVLSTMRWFRDEYEAHIYDRKCPSGVCTDLLTYEIKADKCKGCTLCSKKCTVQAIMGAPKTPHYIIPDKCIGCGTCAEVCRFDAVVVQ